ncbi:hypothetical protein K9B35_19425 [Sphingomonas sp. R647]|uniref:hypothetical protein n=1 Tax=Sphingomonas sp. R647 TaxID=2875233 RepID=UPI001CD7A81C|nr:hypothetical protein [Sphingomonas sp. R647]MCA1200144.1 hypothetical protein [Sphingomonas sp. R647]
MNPATLQDLLVKSLVKKAGGNQRRWRTVVGPISVHDVATHAHCNWSVKPSGTSREIAEVERLLDTMRIEHSLIDAQ